MKGILLDIKQLDSSDVENYIEDKRVINSLATEHTLPSKLKPAADRPEFFTPIDQANDSLLHKRSIDESSSSDVSETSASLEKPLKKSHSES